MPYDPNLPQNGLPLDADAMRAQLQGLFEAISSIPKGDKGDPGQNGSDGGPGGPGPVGPQGPPFAQAVVDAVNTLAAGQNASVSVNFDGTNVRFIFDIPRGNDGTAGAPGNDGAPGEVTLAQMKAATSANTNNVATLDTPFINDPPTPADLETLRAKVNELILALRQN
ncbi:MAG: hypothetical protein JNG86_19990 [Verrucomicrobiaceae bacterium]|nr:hypothetical protein [Verrucomicrobiaceae bacterium]